jgi:hypothetical protein
MEYHPGRLTITSDDVARWAGIALRGIRQRLTTIRQRIPIPARVVGYNSRLYAAATARELAGARELLQQNQIRAAGAVAGVALELHLKHVAAAHSISIRHHATIAQMQDRLRYAGLLDKRQRKLIGKLSTIRNLCVHGRKEEPTRVQVERLITGIEELQRTM